MTVPTGKRLPLLVQLVDWQPHDRILSAANDVLCLTPLLQLANCRAEQSQPSISARGDRADSIAAVLLTFACPHTPFQVGQ